MNTGTKTKIIDQGEAIRLVKMLADPSNWLERFSDGKYLWSPVLIAAEGDPKDIAKQILKFLETQEI